MENLKHGLDITAAAAAFMAVLHTIPEVLAAAASFMSIVWYAIRLIEWLHAKRRGP